MKKILLSCVACLLALGLVTACDNEDEVVENDGTTQDTGTGGGGDTGSGGGTTEVTSLSNYTLSFTLTGEEIPDYATLYITGDWNDWGFEALEVGEGVYTYTFDTITVDWHNFKLVMWYSDEEVDWDSGNYVEVVYIPWVDEEGVTQLGNAYFEVTASQGDDYTLDLEYEVSATLEEKIVSVTGVSISEGSSIVIAPEETVQLHAVVTPSNATDQSVTWAVKEEESDTEPTDPVVTVDQTGLVTSGTETGTATVTVTTTDGGYTASTEVNVVSEESIVHDFTLTITLGEGVEIPSYGELYLSYNGTYTLLDLTSGSEEVVLGDVLIGAELSYSIYLIYSEEYRDLEGCSEVTEDNIVASDTHVVTAEDNGATLTIKSVEDVLEAPVTFHATYTLTIYFAEEIDGQMVYYTIPDRGYAEVGGYYASDTVWADPSEETKLTANAADNEGHVSYTVTLTNVRIAGFSCRIFYFYNDEEDYHEGADFWLDVNPFEDETTVYIAQNPESILVDPEDPSNFCELTIAIKNTNVSQTGFTSGLAPQFYHWVSDDEPKSAFVNMTQGECGTYTSSSDYYFTIGAESGASDGAERTYRVAKGESFSFQISCSGITDQWATVIQLTSDISWSEELPLSNNNGAINIADGYLNHDSVLVVLGFDFNAFDTTKVWGDGSNLFNTIITEAQFIVDWNVQTQG